MFIGDVASLNFDKSLEYRTLDEVNADTLKRDKKYQFSFVVINDLDGKMELSDETLSAIRKCIETDRCFNLMYLGRDFEKLEPLGIFGENGSSGRMGLYLTVDYMFGMRSFGSSGTDQTSISSEDIMRMMKESVVNFRAEP